MVQNSAYRANSSFGESRGHRCIKATALAALSRIRVQAEQALLNAAACEVGEKSWRADVLAHRRLPRRSRDWIA